MNASWLSEILDWLLKSTVLIALAWAAAFGARKLKAPAALRHLLWLSAISGAVALPMITAITPVRVEILPAFWSPTPVQSASAAVSPAAWTLVDIMVTIYACVFASLLLRVGAGQWGLRRIWRRALSVHSIQAQSNALASALGLRRRVIVRIADDAVAPMTWGFAEPRIVLPAASIGWPMTQRRLVLMHELAHVARGDGLTQLLASIALAFFWFNPALWFAVTRLRREQEHACDDRVLLAGASPDVYARTLLDVAARRFDTASAAVMMAAPSHLETRLKTIVTERPRMFNFAGGAVTMVGVCIVLAAAAVAAPTPTPPRTAETPTDALVAPVAQASPTPRAAPEARFLRAPRAELSAVTAPKPVTPLSALPAEDAALSPAARANLADMADALNIANRATPHARGEPVSALSPVPAITPGPFAPTPLVAPAPVTPVTPAIAPVAPTPVTPLRPRAPRPQPS